MTYRLGVDVGGTFTDLLLVHEDTGDQARVKTPSTPADPSQGVLAGVKRVLEQRNVSIQEVSNLMHGTTVATNAVLESKGARVGLITTPNPRAAGRLDYHDQTRSAGSPRGHA
jgi:N-methylhydantoinase A